jgi:hypothetical protein
MKTDDLNNKILYFEMHTHPPDKSALFFSKGWAKMQAHAGGSVTISWPDFPRANSFKAVTFRPETVAEFKKNESGKSFDLRGEPVTPDFIYIEA